MLAHETMLCSEKQSENTHSLHAIRIKDLRWCAKKAGAGAALVYLFIFYILEARSPDSSWIRITKSTSTAEDVGTEGCLSVAEFRN